jgi:hypothetical protein
MITLQSNDLLLLRKPSPLASTPGKELSIFDILLHKNPEKVFQKSYDIRAQNWSTV